jgi:hypothetical protein
MGRTAKRAPSPLSSTPMEVRMPQADDEEIGRGDLLSLKRKRLLADQFSLSDIQAERATTIIRGSP